MTYADPMLEVKKNEYNIYSLLKKLVRNILYKRLITDSVVVPPWGEKSQKYTL